MLKKKIIKNRIIIILLNINKKQSNIYLSTTKRNLPIQMCLVQCRVQQFFSMKQQILKIVTKQFMLQEELTTSWLDTIVHNEIPVVIMPTEIYLSRVYLFFNIITPITMFAINEPWITIKVLIYFHNIQISYFFLLTYTNKLSLI